MKKPLAIALLLLVPAPVLRADESPAKKTEVDESIAKALEFLAATQDRTDGAWKLGAQKNHAATSLAVMAFLSAGHVPGEGKYGDTVEKGIRWVLKNQQANGLLANDGNLEMYNHGISTLMLAEVAGMTDGKLGEEVRGKLVKAVEIILKAQRDGNGSDTGGWRYRVQHVQGSDISVTGWQIMALRAAKNLGCDVPGENIDRAVEYIKRCQDKSTGGFRILALELCGKDKHRSAEVLQGGAYLIKEQNLPRWGGGSRFFFYGLYYCSQATFQLGGNYWSVFRPKLHEVLLRNQMGNGSWPGIGSDGALGPNYCTAMAVLAMTVEYRFLPIYQRDEESAEIK
jgi:hypothetical protein